MKIFDYLADRQTLIFNLFNKIKGETKQENTSLHLCVDIYKLEVKLMEEITKYLNTQFILFKQLGDLGYEEILKPMFIYRFDVRQMLLLLHEHQEVYQSPNNIHDNFTDYRSNVKSLFLRFRECIKKDNINFSQDFQSILKKVEAFNPKLFETATFQ